MPVRIGINGFGRIGRYLVKLLSEDKDVDIAVINARADNATLAHLLKYDSTHGRFPDVSYDDEGLIVRGRHIPVTRCPLGEWDWEKYDVDIAVETSGKIKDREGLAAHLACGAKKAINAAPLKNADVTIVMGVNEQAYDPAAHDVVSAASCTTNCLAPATKVILKNFGIKHGLMTTIHSYTMSQRILDGTDKDLRRGRSAAVSMIPTTTGAAKAIGLVIPELNGKLDGMAIRVPTPNVSIVDVIFELAKQATAEEINAALQTAANESLGYSDEPLVSVDYTGDTHGGVVDAQNTKVLDGTMLKLLIWYDNEAGFTHQLLRLIKHMAKKMSAS